jgi:hypothetical protein
MSNTDDLFTFILGGFLAFLLILWIYSKIMQGVDAAKKDVEEDGGNVKGCVQIIGWIFIGLVIYWVLNM